MKRRDFLRAGAAMAGGAAALVPGGTPGAENASPDRRAVPASADAAEPDASWVLITSAETPLARTVATALAAKRRVRLTATSEVETDLPFTACELEVDPPIAALVRGAEVIVHVWPGGEPGDESKLVDRWPRQTYNLLRAAVAEGVKRVVYLSSLELLDGYDEKYLVDEDWRPQADPGSGLLPVYLGEFCCREFARQGRLEVVVLRLGPLAVPKPGKEAEHPSRLYETDLVQAIERALTEPRISDARGIPSWSVMHLTSDAADSRFPITRARRLLGFEPQARSLP